MRSAIFRALGKIARMIGGMADEPTSREVWKQARNAATSDKAAVAQTSALQVGGHKQQPLKRGANLNQNSVLKS